MTIATKAEINAMPPSPLRNLQSITKSSLWIIDPLICNFHCLTIIVVL